MNSFFSYCVNGKFWIRRKVKTINLYLIWPRKTIRINRNYIFYKVHFWVKLILWSQRKINHCLYFIISQFYLWPWNLKNQYYKCIWKDHSTIETKKEYFFIIWLHHIWSLSKLEVLLWLLFEIEKNVDVFEVNNQHNHSNKMEFNNSPIPNRPLVRHVSRYELRELFPNVRANQVSPALSLSLSSVCSKFLRQ